VTDGGPPASSGRRAVRVRFAGGADAVQAIQQLGQPGDVRGRVDGLDAAGFEKAAQEAKAGCPVSKALAGVDITLDAALAD